MRTALKTSLALLAGSLLFTACDKCQTPSYTEVTEQDTDWLVYDTSDTIRFVNQADVPVKFIRTAVYSNNVPADGYSYEDKCIDKMDTEVGVVLQDVTRKMPAMATFILKKPNDLRIKLMIDNLGTYEIDEENPNYESIEVAGKTYHDVFEKTVEGNDTDNKGKIKRILFNKSKGFIRVEYFGGTVLQLQN